MLLILRRKGPSSSRVVEIRETAKTNRAIVRWNALRKILPAGFASASAYGVATVQEPSSGVNIVLGVLLVVVTISAVAKIGWDAHQKREQRRRLDELERENTLLRTGQVPPQQGRTP